MSDRLQAKDDLKVIQLTDLHLFSSDNELMLGHKNNANFYDVIFKLKNTQLETTDLILLTGDLSQDQTRESYEHIVRELKDFNIPIYWISGNHDHKKNISAVFSKNDSFKNVPYLELKHWFFIFLDTKKEGSESGFLAESEIFFLKNTLDQQSVKNKKIAIIMHHHPVPFGTPLIDDYILKNHEEFWRAIIKHNITKILCGHVHGDYSFIQNNTLIESSVATCFQFKKGSSSLVTENNIGYKVHYFRYNTTNSQSFIWTEPVHVK